MRLKPPQRRPPADISVAGRNVPDAVVSTKKILIIRFASPSIPAQNLLERRAGHNRGLFVFPYERARPACVRACRPPGRPGAAAGMRAAARRLLIGYLALLLGGFIAAAAGGNPGASGLSAAYPGSSHTASTPTRPYLQACQFLFFVFFILGDKVPVSPPPPPPPLSGPPRTIAALFQEDGCEIPRRRRRRFSFPPAKGNGGRRTNEKLKRTALRGRAAPRQLDAVVRAPAGSGVGALNVSLNL